MEVENKKPKNPSAYPSFIIDHRESATECRTIYEGQEFGMTLRDYFAAKAMQGVIASTEGIGLEINYRHCDIIAKKAYMYADAMLKEREKQE